MKRKENDDRRQEVEGKLIALSAMEQKELFEKYEVDEYGLDPVQASDRLDEYGRNIIDFGKEKSLAVRIKDAIINPFNRKNFTKSLRRRLFKVAIEKRVDSSFFPL